MLASIDDGEVLADRAGAALAGSVAPIRSRSRWMALLALQHHGMHGPGVMNAHEAPEEGPVAVHRVEARGLGRVRRIIRAARIRKPAFSILVTIAPAAPFARRPA